MNGVVARRNNFNEPILGMLKEAYAEFGRLTGRHYGFIQEYKTEDADTVFVSLGCAAENIEAACDYLRGQRNAKVGSIHVNVLRPFPEAAVINALRGKKNVIIIERTDEGMALTVSVVERLIVDRCRRLLHPELLHGYSVLVGSSSSFVLVFSSGLELFFSSSSDHRFVVFCRFSIPTCHHLPV